MNLNKKYLLFPKPRLSHLLFLFYFISSVVKQGLLKYFKEEDHLSIPVFKLYIYDIGDFISLIPYLILKKKSKSDNNIIQTINDNNKETGRETGRETGKETRKEIERPTRKDTVELNYIYTDIKGEALEEKKKKSYIYILIISIIDFIAQISTVTYYLIEGNQKMKVQHGRLTFILIFNIIFLFLLSKFMLNGEFYLHHYISLIIFIICLIVIVTIDFIEIKKESKDFINSLLYVVIRIFIVLLYSIEDILAKLIFLKYFITPYFLLLSKAIIQFLFLIIFSIPLCFVKFRLENNPEQTIFEMIDDIFDKNKLFILYYIIYLINSFFYNILNYLIIDKFFSTHTAIAKIFENFGILLINIIVGSLRTYLAVRIIMYILLILASFIYNEFLVINVCGLANNTQLFLDYKEKKEKNELSLIKDNNVNEHLTEVINEQGESINSEHENNIELTEYY